MEPTRATWARPADAVATAASAADGAQAPGPRKRIHTQEDLRVFVESRLCDQLISYVGELSMAARGVPCEPGQLEAASQEVRGLTEMLFELERWIADFPPIKQPMRFGNKAFASWHARLVERGEEVLRNALGDTASVRELAADLAPYLHGSFGHELRIDYGTGHEACFLSLIFALSSKGILKKSDARDIVVVLFHAYIRLMRTLQVTYMLEPAGSHGVWGLDDYHCLPFVFGAAQLIGKDDEVPTSSVYKEPIQRDYADQFLYVDAIRQILRAKTGAPFHETSPMLYDITGVPTWQVTHSGLVKLFRGEVLGKFPVIQHFLFGGAIPWPGDERPGGAQG